MKKRLTPKAKIISMKRRSSKKFIVFLLPRVIMFSLFSIFLIAFGFVVKAQSEAKISQYNLGEASFQIQKSAKIGDISMTKKENNKEELVGKANIADQYFISEISENEFLNDYSFLNSGFQDLKISIESDQPLFKKENFKQPVSFFDQTKKLFGFAVLPEYRLVKQVDRTSEKLKSKLVMDSLELENSYWMPNGEQKIKQGILLKNNSQNQMNLRLTLDNFIKGDVLNFGGSEHFIMPEPRSLAADLDDKVAFSAYGQNFIYDFSDLKNYNPEVWFFKKDSQNSLLVKLSVSLDANSSLFIDPGYYVGISSTNTATAWTHQRKTWWDGTRYWIAYSTGSNSGWFATGTRFFWSTNGFSWTENTTASSPYMTEVSVWADPSYLFAVWASSGKIYAGQATNVGSGGYPGTGWGWYPTSCAACFGATISQEYNGTASWPFISRNSGGYIGAVWRQEVKTSTIGVRAYGLWARFTSNAYNVRAWGNTTTLEATTNNLYKYGILIPASTSPLGGFVFIWTSATSTGANIPSMYSRFWQSPIIGWTNPTSTRIDYVATSFDGKFSPMFSAVYDETNKIHLFYASNSNNAAGNLATFYKYLTLTDTTTWSTSSILVLNSFKASSFRGKSLSISLNTSTQDLYAFYIETTSASNAIYYDKGVSPYALANWTTGTLWQTSSGSGGGNATTINWLTTNYANNGRIFAGWTEWNSTRDYVNWERVLPSYLTMGNVTLNSGNAITLSENGTTSVVATTSIWHNINCGYLSSVTSSLYRTTGGVEAQECTANDNNCYIATCSTSSNSMNKICNASCSFNVWFHAQPTDAGTYSSEYWIAKISAVDQSNNYVSATSALKELNTLAAGTVSKVFEYYYPGDFATYTVGSTGTWQGQTFAIGTVGQAATHSVSAVKARLARPGYPTGENRFIEVAIQDFNASGYNDIASSTMLANQITTASEGSWYTFTFLPSAVIQLASSTRIVFRTATGSDVNNKFYVFTQDRAPGYSGGAHYLTNDWGQVWLGVPAADDLSFEEYGSGNISYGSMNPGSTSASTSINTLITNTGNCSVNTALYGENMVSGSNEIDVGQQYYNTQTLAFALGSKLLVSPGTVISLDCGTTTSHPSSSTDDIYWGIQIPYMTSGTYVGTNTFEISAR
jgi:hypothetical protein